MKGGKGRNGCVLTLLHLNYLVAVAQSKDDEKCVNEVGSMLMAGDEEDEEAAAYLITEREFGVICSVIDLPSSFSMVKEAVTCEGGKTYIRTLFKYYTYNCVKEGRKRYVLSGDIFLTVQDVSKRHFANADVSWFIALQKEDKAYKDFFQKNKNGYYNELYKNVLYIRNMDVTKLDLERMRKPYPERKYTILLEDAGVTSKVENSGSKKRSINGSVNGSGK